MNIRHARSVAVASLLLSASLVGCESGERINGVYYAPSGTTPTGIQIARQLPAGLALDLEKAPPVEKKSADASAPTTEASATAPAPTTDPAATAPSAPVVAATEASPATKPADSALPPTLALNQKMVVDLATGKTVVTDTDGSIYPLTTTPSDLEFFRKAANTTSWRKGPLWSKETVVSDQFLYTATAMSGADPIKDNARWLAPLSQKLPDTIQKMHEVFELQQRKVHPLSERVDLLK